VKKTSERTFDGPFFDALVREAYDKSKHRKPAVRKAAERAGCAKITVYKRAIELGLVQPSKRQLWDNPDEIGIVTSNAHLSAKTIVRKLKQAGFHRGESAVFAARIRFAGYSEDAKLDADVTTANQLAALLGTASIVVSKWARAGLIKGKRVEGRGLHGEWNFRSRDIRDFIIAHTAHVNFAHVDKFWLVDILCPTTGAKGGAREAA
jgi:hypothetical protein